MYPVIDYPVWDQRFPQAKKPDSESPDALVDQLKSITGFLASSHKGYILNEKLEIVKKEGFRWFILALLQPFYRLFGKDAYSHVRIFRVAEKILTLCQKHKEKLSEKNPLFFQVVKVELFDRLNNQTQQKYTKQLNSISDRLLSLTQDVPENYIPEPIWPEDLSTVNVSEEQAERIKSVFNEVLPLIRQNPYRYTLEFTKTGSDEDSLRELTLKERWGWDHPSFHIVQKHTVPLSLHISNNPNQLVEEITLISKKIVGRGSQTKVRLCHPFFTGKQVVRKNCRDPFTKQLMQNHFLNQNLRGIVPVLGIREMGDKHQILEPLFTGTLRDIIEEKKCDSAEKKLSLIEELLQGVSSVHRIRVHSTTIKNKENRTIKLNSFQLFHSDIKPENILVNDRFRPAINDWGLTNPILMGGTPSFMSPEFVGKIFEPPSDMPYYDRQPGDIWAMGLVFVMILTNQTLEDSTCKTLIPCIKNLGTFLYDFSIKKITQEELDKELESLAQRNVNETDPLHREMIQNLWNLVSKMLKVNPDQRITADAALAQFENLKRAKAPDSRDVR